MDNYTDLGIVSANKPADAYRIIETEAGVLYMVDSVDSDLLLKSTDKGDNWSTVFEEDGWEIEAIFYDYTTKYLWIARNKAGDHPIVHYFDTDDSDNKLDMDQWSTGDAGTYTVLSIFRTNNKIYAITFEDRAGTETFSISKIDVDPMVNTDSEAQAGAGDIVRWTLFLPTGTDEGFFFAEVDKPDTLAYYFKQGIGAFLDVGAFPVGYTLHTGYTKTAIAKADLTYGAAYIILTKTATGVEYLYSFTTDTYDWTELGEFDLLLQAETLSQSTVAEKAFHTTEYKVYQFHPLNPRLYLIAVPDTDAVIIAITDNFFINNDGDMWEYEDKIASIASLNVDHQIEESSIGSFTQIKDTIGVEKNMLVRFYHNYTTATATAEDVIFEGLITNYFDGPIQTVALVSLAKKEMKTTFPSGDYTKDTDGLVSQLITDYNIYVTPGTLSDGADLGTVTLGGVLSEETTWDKCAEFEGFIWYLTPTGALYFNNATVDSGVNYTQASVLSNVRIDRVRDVYNSVRVRGAYVSGVQMVSAWTEDTESIYNIGRNRIEILIPFLNTVALCNTAATNILAILIKDPLRVKFTIQDTTNGYIQVGETITFEYASSGKTVASAQFIITSASINKYGDIRYTIVSDVV